MKKSILSAIFAAMLLAWPASGAESLSLDKYLQRVEAENPDIIAINYSIEAAWQKVLEMDMAYSSFISGSYNRIDDRSGPGFGSTLVTDQMKANVLNVNATRKFSTGTNVSLGYSYTSADFSLLSPLNFNGANYSNFTGYQISPTLSLSQSLLRDFNSGLTQAGINKAKAAVLSGQYMMLYKKQQLMLAARSAYWSLALNRDVVEFRKASLARAEKLLKWNENKIKLDLIEKSDLLQTQAAYKLRQLNLQSALEDETRSCRGFNEMLGTKSETVSEGLDKISDKVSAFASIASLESTGKRADVLAAESSFKSSQYAETETKYRAMPELSLNGSYALNGIGLAYSDAWDQISTQDKPVLTIGLSFVVPLDYKTLRKVRKGYTNDFSASKETFRAAMNAAQNDWDQIQANWRNVKSRLDLAQEIMQIQEERVRNEQNKLERGRTTTFLLLSAENDLDDATLSVYRTVFEEIITLGQAELYNTQPITNK